jgi:hypothetical protein
MLMGQIAMFLVCGHPCNANFWQHLSLPTLEIETSVGKTLEEHTPQAVE